MESLVNAVVADVRERLLSVADEVQRAGTARITEAPTSAAATFELLRMPATLVEQVASGRPPRPRGTNSHTGTGGAGGDSSEGSGATGDAAGGR